MKGSDLPRARKRTVRNAAKVAPVADRSRGVLRTIPAIKRTQRVRRSNRDFAYPAGSIGRVVAQRDYVHYLVDRYHRSRQLERRFANGRSVLNLLAIFGGIEREFKAPLYFIPNQRFEDLIKYLHRRLERTVLGRSNRARGIPNYLSAGEFAVAQSAR